MQRLAMPTLLASCLMLSLSACKQEPSEGPPPSPQDVKAEAGEAAQVTGEYIDAKRKEFVESMESKLDQLSKELDEMGKAAADKSDELRNDYREYHSSAKTKIEELRTQLGQAKDQGAEA